MPASARRHLVERRFRSCSQKNLASESRAAITFSLPAMICSPPSLGVRLDTSRNLLASLPVRGCFSEKHFWCCFMDSIRHSAGTSRNASSKLPISTSRPFGEAGVLGEQRLVLDQGELVLLGERARLLADQAGALGGVAG